MPDRPIMHDNGELLAIIAQTRILVRSAAELVKQPPPDTFLGRATLAPLPIKEPTKAIGECRRPDTLRGRPIPFSAASGSQWNRADS